MAYSRSSGILLHPTSLPGQYGIGDLGEWAYRFVDWLESTGQSVWQILPLGPTSYGDSPYQTLSAFAGNPLLISLDKLVGAGWHLIAQEQCQAGRVAGRDGLELDTQLVFNHFCHIYQQLRVFAGG